jgi:ATP-binding cassette subfamily C protein
MKLILYFARAYPWQSLLTILCLIVAAAFEGMGLATLLPIIGIASQEQGGSGAPPVAVPSGIETAVRGALGRLGLSVTLEILLVTLVAISIVKAAILLVANRQVGYTVAHVATDLRLQLLRALMAARWGYYTRQSVGRTANSIATEADRASRAYHNLAITLEHAATAVLAGVFALVLSWRLTLIALVGGALIWLVLSVLVRLAGRAGLRQTRITKSLLGRLADALQSVKLFKAMGRERLIGPLLSHDTRRLNRELRRQVVAKESLTALQEPLVFLLLAGILLVSLRGMGISFERVFVLVIAFGKGLSDANKAQRRYQLAVTDGSALWSMRELIDGAEAAVEISRGTAAPSLATGISLRGIRLHYEGRPVLEGVDLEIPAGEITAIVGGSGSGKTTLVDLLTGLVQPESGELRIDDRPLRDLDLARWRAMIGYVPQDLPLLHDSVRVNVSLGDPGISEAEILSALRDAGATEFVSQLPEGLDSSVGERGALLSGGQRARLALARALVHRPALLILDEATAALDPEAEAELWRTMEALRGRTTIVAISHQPALAGVADRIYRIEEGAARLVSGGAPEPAAAGGVS